MATTAPTTVRIPELNLVLDNVEQKTWYLHVDGTSEVPIDWYGPLYSPADIARQESHLEYCRMYGHRPANTIGKVVEMTEAELWSLHTAAKAARLAARGLA